MVDLFAGITAAKALLEVTAKVTDMAQSPETKMTDVRGKLHEMLIHAASALTVLNEAQIEIFELRHQLDDRNRLKELGSNLTFDEGVYWYREYPYCPNCWEVDQKPMRMAGPTQSSYSRDNVYDFACHIHRFNHSVTGRKPWAS